MDISEGEIFLSIIVHLHATVYSKDRVPIVINNRDLKCHFKNGGHGLMHYKYDQMHGKKWQNY